MRGIAGPKKRGTAKTMQDKNNPRSRQLDINELRRMQSVRRQVDKTMKNLGQNYDSSDDNATAPVAGSTPSSASEDSDSSADEQAFAKKSRQNRRSKTVRIREKGSHGYPERREKPRKLKSGRVAKITDNVVDPQIWPHTQLRLQYVTRDIAYEQLDVNLFVPGFREYISNNDHAMPRSEIYTW